MNNGGCASQMLLDVSRHVAADHHNRDSFPNNARGARVAIPTRWPEGIELRRVCKVNDAAGCHLVRFPQKHVAHVFGRNQHPVWLKALNVFPERLRMPDKLRNGEDLDTV